ncbi:hypothetical protein [Aporhodopirellula aestuarii]|uniref:HEAT repeat domain-containing protein n=1 Tax=Aporhodopirellula aestuarii TaxID=2950107 RepID=A0ABT0U6N1_9BACT|nr:hypothetical protein [Aporhodopirellula aestuarii]MCM2372584.1 hypothetical protein [Aporhodopirellula aestuarii]
MPTPLPEDDWKKQLDQAKRPSELLPILQDLASQEDVSGIARKCLELLAHEDSEIRIWAAEALESSALPDASETEELTQWLEHLLAQQANAAKKPFAWPGTPAAEAAKASPKPDEELAASLLADQLYWTATMLGRIGADAASADPALARLEQLGQDAGAKPFHDAAARATVMRKRLSA